MFRRIEEYLEMLPLYEKDRVIDYMYFTKINDDTAKRVVKEISPLIENVPVVKVDLPLPPAEVDMFFDFEDEEKEEVNLLYDYVYGVKSVPINVPEVLGSKIIGLDIRYPWKDEVGSVGGVIKLNTLYLMKPDFLKGKKVKRMMPFRRGWLKIYLKVKYVPKYALNDDGLTIEREGREEKFLIGEVEAEWIRHGKPVRTGIERVEKPSLWGEVLVRVKLYDHVKGKGRTPKLVKEKRMLVNFKLTYEGMNPVLFGNQFVDVVKRKKITGKPIGENVNVFKVDRFNHVFKGGLVKYKPKKRLKDVYRFKPTLFDVYVDEDCDKVVYYLVPRSKIGRIIIESGHHYAEGWGRILVQVKEGEEVRFTHFKRHYIEIEL